MKSIESFDALSQKLNEAEEMQATSDDAFRQSLSSWRLSPMLFGKAPPDPFSPEYRSFQLGMYERLANKAYDVANEQTLFDFDSALQRPYPYGTKSAQTVGKHLVDYGWLIQKMNLPQGSRILDIGSGYGSLTLHLAQMGYRVTCLDISAELLNFVLARTAHLPEPVKIICGDMATVQIEGEYDAVIFNASLHHSLEHRAVLERMDYLLAVDGIMAFAAEPILPNNSEFVPYPWGLRLNGLSIWAIVKSGWMELGFQESYFTQLLQDVGWKPSRHLLGLSAQSDVWTATRANGRVSSSTIASAILNYDTDLESGINSMVRKGGGLLRRNFITRWLQRP